MDTPAGSETASIKVADGRMDSGLLQVTSGNTVNFTLQDLQNGTVDSTATYADKIFTVNGGTIDVAGTLALSGGSASGDATFDFSNDALVLKASGASVTGVPKISVTGAAAGQTIFKISQANLTEYLNDADDETADNAGAIQVADYGVLELSDTDINLNDDVFVFAAAATPAAGKISVAQTATLRGQNITIDEALNGGDNFSGSIAATNLTLGSALDSLEGIAANASGYSVDEDIDLQADDFTINKAITLGKVDDDESTTEVEDTIAGTLTGNNVTVAETVTVKGNYTFDTKNLNLSGATINVGNGGLAELTLQGTLVLQDGSAANAVTVSGADGEFAVLDLSQLTDIDNQHASKLSTFTASGNGTIKIDGTDLGELASGDHTAQSGAAFVIKEGTLEATSDVALNVANLVSANAANASGNSITFASDATASTINTFKVDGDLTLQADILADDKLNIGASGAIVADTLALNIADTTDLQADSDDIFTVSAGTLTVNQGLSSNTDGVLFDGTTTTSALNLGAADNEVLADDVNGTVNTDLTFSGGSAKLIVNDGTWTVQDLALQAGTVATIGQASFNTANADAMAVETSFTAQNVQISGASSALTVNATAAASINALNIADGATGITVSGSTLTLHGADYSADDEATQALAVTYGVSGINYANDTITVTDHGRLTFTGTALAGMLDTENASDTDSEQDGFMHTTTGDGDSATTTVEAFLSSGYGTIKVEDGAVLALDYDDSVSLTADEYVALKKKLVSSSSLNGNLITSGYIDIGSAEIAGYTDAITVGEDGISYVAWDDIKDLTDLYDLKQEDMEQAVVTGFAADDSLGGSYGAVQADSNSIDVGHNSSLNNAAANDGMFVSYNGQVADANVQAGVELQLNNGGAISDVTLEAGTDEQYPTTLYVNGGSADALTTIASVNGDKDSDTAFITAQGNTQVSGNVEVGYYEVGGQDDVNGTITTEDLTVLGGSLTAGGSITTSELSLLNGCTLVSDGTSTAQKTISTNYLNVDGTSALSTGTLNVELRQSDSSNDEPTSSVKGLVTAENLNLTLQAGASAEDFEIAEGGAVVVSDTVTAATGVTIRVGLDAVEDDPATTDVDESRESSNGYFYAGTLDLNGGEIVIDPDYTADDSLAAVDNLSDAPATGALLDGYDAGTLNGNFTVAENGIGLIGTGSVEESLQAADYVKTLGLDAALLLNKTITVDSGYQIVIDPTRTAAEVAEAKAEAVAAEPDTAYAADLVLEEGGALVVTGNAIEGANLARVGNATTAADTNKAVVNFDSDATIGSLGGEVIIADGYDVGDTIHLFADTNGGVLVEGDTDLVVRSVNGLLKEVIAVGETVGTVNLGVDLDNARAIISAASDPVFDTIIKYAAGDLTPYDDTDDADGANALHSGVYVSDEEYQQDPSLYEDYESVANADGYHEKEAFNGFLNEAVKSGNGSETETLARMAIYGGAVQAANMASASSYEAIATRLGMGNPSGVMTFADNTNGAGIWLAPIYKTMDSDGFDAQGVDYGADVDLYGVALGADYTFAQGFRAGAMFNIGSGDADGQGAGSAVSNDFDYWGASIYGGYSYGNFSLSAYVGYTVVDNDIDGHTALDGYNKLEASTDSTALTVGVNAQYKFEFAALDVTPHIGARFTKLDLDDYDVKSNGAKIAESDQDSMNIFSIPVGVVLSKDFATASGWNIKPALDLVVTANTGDDEMDSDLDFVGISNLTTSMSTEVIDSFTYGANASVQLQKDAFQFGLGVNYTGSDNTDELGVVANARFTF